MPSRISRLLGILAAFVLAACGDDALTEPQVGTITVTVSADGEPVSGVRLSVSGETSAQATSDAAGSASFTDLPAPGTYVVRVIDTPSGVELDGEERVDLAAGRTASASFNGSFLLLEVRVARSEGITGVPAAGVDSVRYGTALNYAFSVADGYEQPSVTLNQEAVELAGAIAVEEGIELVALAKRRPNVPSEVLGEYQTTQDALRALAGGSGDF